MGVNHTNNKTEWDEYKTSNNTIIGVEYTDNRFNAIHVRFHAGGGTADSARFDSIDEADEFLTALHAAMAGIYKKGLDNGTENN